MACNLEYKGKEYGSVFELGQAIARENGMGQRAEKLYSAHLQNWTKDSIVKDILYHGSSTKLDKHRINMKAGGMWFSPDKNDVINFSKSVRDIKNPVVNSVVVNIKNPVVYPSWDFYLGVVHYTGAFKQETSEKAIRYGKDGILIEESLWNYDPENPANSRQYVVFDPKQILVLGSDEDVEAFKAFAENPTYPEGPSLSSLNGSGDSASRFLAKKERLIQYIKNHPNLTVGDIVEMLVGDADFTERDVRDLYLHLADNKTSGTDFAKKAHNSTINNKITQEHLDYFINILNKETSLKTRFASGTVEEHVARALQKYMVDNNVSTFRQNVAHLMSVLKNSDTFGLDSTDVIALWIYKGLLERDLESTATNMSYENMQELLEAKKQMQSDVLQALRRGTSDAGLTLRLVSLLSSNLAWDADTIEANFIAKYEKQNNEPPSEKQLNKIRTLSKRIKELEDEYALTLRKAAKDFETASEATAEEEIKERVLKGKKSPTKSSIARKTSGTLTDDRKSALKAFMKAFEDNMKSQKAQDNKIISFDSKTTVSSSIPDTYLGAYYALINTLVNEVINATLYSASQGNITDLNTNLPAVRREVNFLLEDIYNSGAWPAWLPPFEEAGVADIEAIKSAIISSTVTNRKLLAQQEKAALDTNKKVKDIFDTHISELKTLLNKAVLRASDITNIYKNITILEHYINQQRGKGIPMATIHEMANSMVAVHGAAQRIIDGIRNSTITTTTRAVALTTIETELDSVLTKLKLTQADFDLVQDIIDRIEDPNDYRVFDVYNPSLKLKDVYRKLNDLGEELAEAKEDALEYIKDQVTKTTGLHKLLDFIDNAVSFKRAVTLSLDVSMMLFQGGLITLAFVPGVIFARKKTLPIFKKLLKDTVESMKHPLNTAVKSSREGLQSKDFLKAVKMQSDQKKALEMYNSIIEEDMQPIRDMAGLVISKPGGSSLARREEFFRSRWVDNLWFTWGLFAASESGFTTYLNILRAAMFDMYVNVNKDATTYELKQWAAYVNMITGVTNSGIDRVKLITTGLNGILNAPRLYWSMITTLVNLGVDPLRAGIRAYKGRKDEARIHLYRALASWGMLLNAYTIGFLVGSLFGGGDDDDPVDFIVDPTSSDFLAVRYNRSRIDMTPYTSYLRTGIKIVKATNESYTPKGIGFGKNDSVDYFTDFWLYKSTPAIGDVMAIARNSSFGQVPLGQHFRHTDLGQWMGGQTLNPIIAKGGELAMGWTPGIGSIAVSSAIKDDSPGGVALLSLMGLPAYTAGSNLEDIRVTNYLEKNGMSTKDARVVKPPNLSKDQTYVWEEISDAYMGDWLLEEIKSGRKPTSQQIRRKANELRPKIKLKFDEQFKIK